jgi:hypothetical protein
VEVIYEHKDFVGWSLDIYRPLNGENFGLGRSESENDGNQNSDNDNYLQGHVIPHLNPPNSNREWDLRVNAVATHSQGPYPVAPVVVTQALIGSWDGVVPTVNPQFSRAMAAATSSPVRRHGHLTRASDTAHRDLGSIRTLAGCRA